MKDSVSSLYNAIKSDWANVRNGAVCPSWIKRRTDEISSPHPIFSKACPTNKSQGPGRTTLCPPPGRPPQPTAVFRCFPPSSGVPHSPLSSLTVLYSYLPSPGRSCLGSWGSSSLVMTAVLGIPGRGQSTFCRPVSSGGPGGLPAGPYWGAGRLRTRDWASPMSPVCGFLNPELTLSLLREPKCPARTIADESTEGKICELSEELQVLLGGCYDKWYPLFPTAFSGLKSLESVVPHTTSTQNQSE